MDEAHVIEHAVGFVEHQDLDLDRVGWPCSARSSRRPGVATRMSTPFCSALICGFMPAAAEDHGRLELEVLAVGLDRFSTWAASHASAPATRAHRTVLAALDRLGAVLQAVQHRQREGSGLAGAGLGAGEQIVTLEHGGNGLGLDRRRVLVALFAHGFQDGRGQLQFFKCHVVWAQVRCAWDISHSSALVVVGGRPV